jgi:hypothetical protein
MQGKMLPATGKQNSFIMENIRAAAAASRGKPGKIGGHAQRPVHGMWSPALPPDRLSRKNRQ